MRTIDELVEESALLQFVGDVLRQMHKDWFAKTHYSKEINE